MATITKCDRCKVELVNKNTSYFIGLPAETNRSEITLDRKFDLCRTCMIALVIAIKKCIDYQSK